MRRWLIERIAQALFEYRALQYSFLERDWSEVREGRRSAYRVEATHVLRGIMRWKR